MGNEGKKGRVKGKEKREGQGKREEKKLKGMEGEGKASGQRRGREVMGRKSS